MSSDSLLGKPASIDQHHAPSKILLTLRVRHFIGFLSPTGRHPAAVAVGGAKNLASLHAATRQQSQANLGPVMAAACLRVDSRRAAKFAPDDNGHVPEHAPIVEISDQGMEGVINNRHELAHAYHDQVLGFEEPRILAAWKKFVASGKYESVKHVSGRMVRHYALTDQKEFFAEMSESYFGRNDFYPFDREELKQAEPEIFKLLQDVWGNELN